jgi:hypothetical protein
LSVDDIKLPTTKKMKALTKCEGFLSKRFNRIFLLEHESFASWLEQINKENYHEKI